MSDYDSVTTGDYVKSTHTGSVAKSDQIVNYIGQLGGMLSFAESGGEKAEKSTLVVTG